MLTSKGSAVYTKNKRESEHLLERTTSKGSAVYTKNKRESEHLLERTVSYFSYTLCMLAAAIATFEWLEYNCNDN